MLAIASSFDLYCLHVVHNEASACNCCDVRRDFQFHCTEHSQREPFQLLGTVGGRLGTGGTTLLNVGVLLICAGFIIAVVSYSGLGFKLSLALVQLGGSNILFILVLAAVSAIVMGMGLPASGTYILLAVLIAPALTQLGMSSLASHFFILYYGNLALITPPIAIGAFVAAGLAESDPMATGWCAMRLAVLAYIIPFLFMFSPALFMKASAGDIFLQTTTAIIATLSLGVALTGYFYRPIPWVRRVLLGLGTSALFISVAVNPIPAGLGLKLIGLAVVAPLFWREWKERQGGADGLERA